MKKKALAAIAAALVCLTASAQQTTATNAAKSIRVGYGYITGINNQVDISNAEQTDVDRGHMLTVDADLWTPTDRLSFGLHTGLAKAEYLDDKTGSGSGVIENTADFHYGINANYHLLPNDARSHWQLTMGGMIGANTNVYANRVMLEYDFNLTAHYYPTAHWGIYAAACFGKYSFYRSASPLISRNAFKVGAAYRF